MALNAGDIIENKYKIVRLLGEGGMGAVFEGENTRIKRKVAIKVLHSAVAADEGATRRFEQEAQAAGHIGNEHIIEVLDLGELPDGDRFMVMEFLDGEPLTSRISRLGRLSPEQSVPLFTQILEGLAAAHDAGILHRDLKPDNIFILNEKMGQKDFVKIIDFGISKFQPLAGEMKMTRTGTIMGTPYYMSPEQASGSKDTSAQSDIYAVGVILYEALTGAVPFDAPTFNQLLFRIVLSEPAPIQQLVPDINPAFASIVSKAMARDPAHRFTSAKQFLHALDNWTRHGTAVTVPPIAAGDVVLEGNANTILAMDGAAPAVGAQTAANGAANAPPSVVVTDQNVPVNGGTAGAWTNTQPTPEKRGAPWMVVAGAAGVLLLGGGAWLALSGSSDAQGTAAAAVESSSAAVQAEDEKPAAPAEDPSKVAEPTQAEEKTVEEKPTDSEVKSAAAEADNAKPTSPEASATASGTASAAPAPVPQKVVRRAPVRRFKPKPQKKATAPKKKKKMDFGY